MRSLVYKKLNRMSLYRNLYITREQRNIHCNSKCTLNPNILNAPDNSDQADTPGITIICIRMYSITLRALGVTNWDTSIEYIGWLK